MIRFVTILLIIGAVALLIYIARFLNKTTTCPSCEGKGYWRETRGEKVHCIDCDGRGYLQKEG